MAAPFKDYINQTINSYIVGGPKIYEKLIYECGVEDGIIYEKNLILKKTCPLLCTGVAMIAIGTYTIGERTCKVFKEKYKERKEQKGKNKKG